MGTDIGKYTEVLFHEFEMHRMEMQMNTIIVTMNVVLWTCDTEKAMQQCSFVRCCQYVGYAPMHLKYQTKVKPLTKKLMKQDLIVTVVPIAWNHARVTQDP